VRHSPQHAGERHTARWQHSDLPTVCVPAENKSRATNREIVRDSWRMGEKQQRLRIARHRCDRRRDIRSKGERIVNPDDPRASFAQRDHDRIILEDVNAASGKPLTQSLLVFRAPSIVVVTENTDDNRGIWPPDEESTVGHWPAAIVEIPSKSNDVGAERLGDPASAPEHVKTHTTPADMEVRQVRNSHTLPIGWERRDRHAQPRCFQPARRDMPRVGPDGDAKKEHANNTTCYRSFWHTPPSVSLTIGDR
jgi:hypothetical protein